MIEYTNWNPETQEITHVYELEDCLKAIRVRNKDNEDLIQSLEAKVKRLESEHYKDEEIQKMKSEIEQMRKEMRAGFPITGNQQEAIKEWKRMHEETVHGLTDNNKRMKAQGVSGGRYTYLFTPTSIGTFGSVRCVCGKEFVFSEP